MDKPTHVLLVAGLTLFLVIGFVWLSRTATVDCWNFLGLTKGCTVSTVK